MPLLNKFCFCMSLRTGTIISGVITIITSVVSILLTIFNAVKIKTIILENISPLAVKIVLSLNMAVSIVTAILLIIGAVKRRTWFLIPYLVLSLIYAIGLPVSVIYTTVEFFLNDDVGYGIMAIVFGLIVIALKIYLWLNVFSFYQLVKEEKNRGPYSTPMYN